jgi:hypothetical protein
MAKKSRVRYNITLPAKFDSILESLSKSEGEPKGEIIRRALALYDYVRKETSDNKNKLLIEDAATKKAREIVFTGV